MPVKLSPTLNQQNYLRKKSESPVPTHFTDPLLQNQYPNLTINLQKSTQSSDRSNTRVGTAKSLDYHSPFARDVHINVFTGVVLHFDGLSVAKMEIDWIINNRAWYFGS